MGNAPDSAVHVLNKWGCADRTLLLGTIDIEEEEAWAQGISTSLSMGNWEVCKQWKVLG